MHFQAREKIWKFIEKQIEGVPLEGESDIFQLGYVDSLFEMQLVGFIEK